jgi:predicted nucleic acid-binding protein
MNRFVWIDTSFLYALFVRSDQYHEKANLIWKTFLQKRITGVTSNLVVSELGTLLVYTFDHAIALRMVGLVLDSAIIKRIYVDSTVESAALAWWKKYADQSFSFPDCVSFELMKRTGIEQALSFDRDFEIAGFQLVRSQHVL